MKIIRTKTDITNTVKTLKDKGRKIGFVPTMGALHQGHLSLITTAKQHCDNVVVSIFVNPTQFAPNEDFDTYPRNEQEDIKKLEERNVDIVYIPDTKDIYDTIESSIDVGAIGQILEGITRPHFFNGVATVVQKLFTQIRPNIAVFGEKDFQQLTIIKQLVKKEKIPTTIIGGATIRESDGLALSSRNEYLSKKERKLAPLLYVTLNVIRQQLLEGASMNDALSWGKKEITHSGFKLDYLELRNEATLDEATSLNEPARLLVAAYLGKTRLIDNISIKK